MPDRIGNGSDGATWYVLAPTIHLFVLILLYELYVCMYVLYVCIWVRKPPFRDAADVIIDKIRDRKTAEPIGSENHIYTHHTYIHTYILAYTFIYIESYMHTYIHTCIP